jgi:hypothetical protein
LNSLSLGTHIIQSQPLDAQLVALAQSQPSTKSIICVNLDQRIEAHHVSPLLSCFDSTSLHRTLKVLVPCNCKPGTRFKIPQFVCQRFSQRATNIMLHKGQISCVFLHQFTFATNIFIYVLFSRKNCFQPFDQPSYLDLRELFVLEHCFHGPKLFMSQLYGPKELLSFFHNSIGPPRTPTRKPPDLFLNLEDKVQVNPSAMLESYIRLK